MRKINYYPYGVQYPHPYYVNAPVYNYGNKHGYRNSHSYGGQLGYHSVTNFDYDDDEDDDDDDEVIVLNDYGPRPFVVDIDEATKQNNAFRTALWTGPNLQVTLMSLKVGEDIGLEMHGNLDQFIRLEQGDGIVYMGSNPNNLDYRRNITDDTAIFVPAGTWHNIINTGNEPLKLYSIYAPPEHPYGTVHRTKNDAMEAEAGYGHNHGY